MCCSMRIPSDRPARASAVSSCLPPRLIGRCCWPPVRLPARPGLGGRQRRRPGRAAAVSGEPGQVGAARWDRTDLTRDPAVLRWMTSVSAQKVIGCPARCGPPELPPGNLHVAAGRDDTLELHRPAAIGRPLAGGGAAAGCPPGWLAGGNRGHGDDRRQPQRQQLLLGPGSGSAEPLRRVAISSD